MSSTAPESGSTPSVVETWLRRWPWAVVLAALLGVALVYTDYGITWDEDVQATYGELVLTYFQSGGADKACNFVQDTKVYGPLFEMLPALFYDHTLLSKFDLRHLLLALLAISMIPAIVGLARQREVTGLAPLAVLALLMLPRFVGHSFNNSKDIPFAVGLAWFMLFATRVFVKDDFRWRNTLGLGAAMGLTLCARPGGFPLLIVLLGCVLVRWSAVRIWTPQGRLGGRDLVRVAVRLGSAVVLAWILMVLPWPWAHENVIMHPVEAMRSAVAFEAAYDVRFEGEMIPSDQLPRHYILKFLLITTPLGLLALAGIGLLRAVRDQVVAWRDAGSVWSATMLVWALAPLAAFMILRPNVYDGIRHALFLLPALALLGAYGAAGILALVPQRAARVVVGVVLVGALLLPVRQIISLHPYQTTYFNEIVGGVAGAQSDFETDYWIASYGEATRWIVDHLERPVGRPLRVLVAGTPYVLPAVRRHATEDMEILTLPEAMMRGMTPDRFDCYLTTMRYDAHRQFPEAPVLHEVGRDGAVFSFVFDLRGSGG